MFIEDYLFNLTLVSAADFKEQNFALTPQFLQFPPQLNFPYRAWFKIYSPSFILAAGGYTPQEPLPGNLLLNYYLPKQANPISTVNKELPIPNLENLLQAFQQALPCTLQKTFQDVNSY